MRNKASNLLSWFAFLVALVCFAGLAVLPVFYSHLQGGQEEAEIWVVMVTAFLSIFGGGAVVSGTTSKLLATASAPQWQSWRAWIAILIGIVAVAVGQYYGI